MCGFVTTGVLLASSNNQPAQVLTEYSLVSPKHSLSFAIHIYINLRSINVFGSGSKRWHCGCGN
jgi:hypothetical protein